MFILSLTLISAAIVLTVGLSTRKAHKAPIRESGHIGALVLTGRIGEGKPLTVTTGMTPRIAPASDPSSVLRLHAGDGAIAYDIDASQIVLMRVLSRGETILAAGRDRRASARTWHVGDMAGWEIQVIASDGTVLHVFGAPGARADAELGRLVERVQATAHFASLASA